jgi:hypothetical protein
VIARSPSLAPAASLALLLAAAVACSAARRDPAACDVSRGACTAAAGDVAVTLDLAPRPLRPLRELEAAVSLSRGGVPLEGAEVSLALSMPGMYMGENETALRPAGGGRHAGRIVLVRCTTGRRDWAAEVVARLPGGGEARARFAFEVAE